MSSSNAQQEKSFLFNGKDLTDWTTTMPELWSVKNRTIIGKHNGKIRRNNFLISKHILRNFHLKFEVKIRGGNSGMQFWSIPISNGEVEGYQADIGKNYWGNLYHEHGKRKNRTLFKNPADKYIKKNDWNQYEIIAIDDKIKTIINGRIITDYIERDKNVGRSYGQLAIQMHRGFGAMQIEVRNFQLKQLPSPPLKKLIKPKASSKKLKTGNSNSPILSPEKEKQHFILPEGFVAELVVSEKDNIRKIVDIAFDTKGRLWASTASEYPADEFKDGANWSDIINKRTVVSDSVKKLWQEGGVDQILIIENPTKNQKKKIIPFSSKRVLPMGVLPYKNNSAIIIEGKKLLLLEDKNKDNQADKTTVLAYGFGKQDTHTGAHGLKYMPGDWVTVINGLLCWGNVTDSEGKRTNFDRTTIAYIKPNGKRFHVVAKGFHNIWGFYQDKVGQGWLQEANNVGYPIAPYYEQMKYFCFMREVQLRPYTTSYPKLTNISLEGSSLSGIEKSDDLSGGFPKKWQELFLVAHPTPSKVQSLKAILQKDKSWKVIRDRDFLVSKDPNFRPIDLEFGPDGCLYIVDWYNPIISHNEVKRDHPLRNKVATRVWRIRHKSQNSNKKIVNMSTIPIKKLINYLQSENSWELESAWKEIAYRQNTSIVPQLKRLVKNKFLRPRFRIHALWSLESLKTFDLDLWLTLLKDDNKFVRTQALRSMRSLHKDIHQTFPALKKLAQKETEFSVIKELINYIGKCKKLSNKHIDFLMRWKFKGTQKERKTRTLPYPIYTYKHYEDVMRIALENHPQEVMNYLTNKSNNKATKNFLTKYVVPFIDKKYAQQAFKTITAKDLNDFNLFKLSLQTEKDPRAIALILKYLNKLPPTQQSKKILQANIKLNDTVRKSLNFSIKSLNLTKFISSIEEETTYLYASIYAKNNLSPHRRSKKDLSNYVKTLIRKYPSLQNLVAQLLIHTNQRNKKLFTLFKDPVYTQFLLSNQTPLKDFDKNHKQTLRQFIKTTALTQREKIYQIFSQHKNSYLHLMSCLIDVTQQEVNQNYDGVSFLISRINSLKDVNRHQRNLVNKPLKHLRNLLKNSKRKKEINENYSRWSKLYDQKGGRLAVGKTLFNSLCLSCHLVQGKGAGIAPNLDGSSKRTKKGLITAITNPSASVESAYRSTNVMLKSGENYRGLYKKGEIQNHIYFMGGGKVSFYPYQVAYKTTSNQSFMPSNIFASLQDTQIKDLLEYIKTLK